MKKREHPGTCYVSELSVQDLGDGQFRWQITTLNEATGEVLAQQNQGPYLSEEAAMRFGVEALNSLRLPPRVR